MAIPEPVGKQQEVVCLGTKGHYVVLGTAGSGKTTMAIARAKYLTQPRLPGQGAVLLITFNKALMRYIRSVAGHLSPHITVENYHLFARGYLNYRGLMSNASIVSSAARTTFIASAVQEVSQRYQPHSFFERSPKFFSDEIKWMSGQNIKDLPTYLDVRRVGRADANLKKSVRPLMWEVRSQYLVNRAASNRLYDLDDIAAAVSLALDGDKTARKYRHVIIDEGQDLSPEMVRSLVKAVPGEGSVTFFGDVAQQIYGRGMSFRDAGLKPTDVWKFSQNYRNTRSIARLGLLISKMPYYAGETDMVEPTSPAADGPKPTLVKCVDANSEIRLISRITKEHAKTRSVAILCRTHALISAIKPYLPSSAVALREDNDNWAGNSGIFFGTYHAAKGLEFDVVALPFVSKGAMPSAEDIEADGEDAFAQDGRLLYVGVTRARTDLILTYSNEISDLLPSDPSLYVMVDDV